MDTVNINLSWAAFSELLDKYRDRVLDDMTDGLFIFTDGSVTLHASAPALETKKADP